MLATKASKRGLKHSIDSNADNFAWNPYKRCTNFIIFLHCYVHVNVV